MARRFNPPPYWPPPPSRDWMPPPGWQPSPDWPPPPPGWQLYVDDGANQKVVMAVVAAVIVFVLGVAVGNGMNDHSTLTPLTAEAPAQAPDTPEAALLATSSPSPTATKKPKPTPKPAPTTHRAKPSPTASKKPKKKPKPSNCDPNYSPCVPVASDVDCAGGSGNGPAYVSGPVYVTGSDIYDLDRDGDGVACD